MLYNLSNEFEHEKALKKFKSLLQKKAIIELTEKKQRSPQSNRYMHVCFGLVAIEYGYTIEEVKQMLFKATLFPEYYLKGVKEVFGKKKHIVLSTRDTANEVLTEQLTKFRNYAATELNVYIPSPEEHKQINLALLEIEKQKQYL